MTDEKWKESLFATGMNGTPMAEYGDDVLRPAHRWTFVECLLSLVGR
jgi:hypothetical protein